MTKLHLIYDTEIGGLRLPPLSAKAALRRHPAEFMALLDEMLDAAESEALRSRAERLKKAATQLPLFSDAPLSGFKKS